MYLSVIIPAYNEEKRLEKTVRSVAEYLGRQFYQSEIIIVNDGSSDSTLELSNRLAQQFSIIKVISDSINHGKGYAVRTGILKAVGDYRLFMDSDGSTPIDQIEKLLPYFDQGFDVVIGSRRVEGADIRTDQPWYRIFLGFIFRNIVNLILPLNVIDSQNGFKAFSAKSAQDIFSKQKIDRWAFDVEVLALAVKLGYKIKEVPIVWTDSAQSKITFGGMVGMLWEIVKVRWGNVLR